MIGSRSHSLANREAWADNLRSLVDRAGISRESVTEHLTLSVAMYCQQHLPHGAKRSDLILLIARAYCSINDRKKAAQILRSIKPHSLHVDRWLEILSELHHFPSLLPYFSTGIVRPADWAGARQDRMWTLDLGRLVLEDAEKHEMMLYRSLRAIIESMLVFWDTTAGEGVLGVKGLAAFNLEVDVRHRQTLTHPGDLLGYIDGLFRREKERRGWVTVPELLNLDL